MRTFRFLTLFVVFGLLQIMSLAAAGIQVQEIKSPGGLKAWFVEDKTTPVISLSFLFNIGSVADPEGKEGVADLTATMLTEGAGDLDKQAYIGILQDLAIGLGYSASFDTFSGQLTTLKDNREEAVRLLNLTLTQPRLEPQALERVINQQLTSLANFAQDPNYLANIKIYQSLFADHPYSRPISGTLKTIPRITGGDIKNYIRENLTQDRLIIGITGNLTAQEAGEFIDKAFKGIPPTGKIVEIPHIQARDLTQTVIIPQNIPQSLIVFAHNGLRVENPDILIATVLMQILGTGEMSRLNEEIREQRGMAYSARAWLVPLKDAGLVIGDLGTSNKNVKQCLSLTRAEWKRIHDQGVTLKELNNAKANLIGSFPLRFTNSSAIAETLVSFQYGGKNADYFNERAEMINKISLKEMNAFAKRFLKPESLLFVVVGKPEGLEEENKKEISQ